MKTRYFNLYDVLLFANDTALKVKNKLAFLVDKHFGRRFTEDVFFDVYGNIENNLMCKYSWSAFVFKFDRSEVYKCMYNLIKDNSYYNITMSEYDFTSEMLNYEMLALCDIVGIDASALKELRNFKASKYKVVGVIDICYSTSFVMELLDRLEILDLFDSVVTSQELINLHFNGSFSDYFKSNINASIRYSIKTDKPIKSIDKELNDIFKQSKKKTVFANYAFPLYLFVRRLYDELRRKKYNKVFFFAREGKFLKKIFDLYSFCQEEKIESYYLEVSRNSLLVPSLKPMGEENFSEIVKGNCQISVIDFLTTLTFDADEISIVIENLELNAQEKLPLFTYSPQFDELCKNEDFLKLYEQKRSLQYNNTIAYLSQFGINEDIGSFAVVDVGWGGTMQNCLKKILKTVEIDGYYLGVTVDSNVFLPGNRKYGLLFEEMPFTVTVLEKLFKVNMFDYEIILKADTPKTQGYVFSGNSIIPYYEESTEVQTYFRYIKPVQDVLEVTFNKIVHLFEERHCFDYRDRYMIKYTFRLAMSMGYREIRFRNEVQKMHVEGFGNCGEIYKNNKIGFRDFLVLYRNKIRVIGLYYTYIRDRKCADRSLYYKLR